MNFIKARNSMVENQLKPNKITDSRIFDIFNEISKEVFVKNELQDIVYSDVDINLTVNRGYLKNLHIAQLIQYAKINKEDKVLHIGGLTGYVTLILSKLSNYVVVVENDEHLLKQLKENIIKFQLTNVEIVKHDLKLGYKESSPYELIFIDCPIDNFSNKVLNQLNPNHGRLIMIEKINNDLGKGMLITRNNKNYNKEIIFDVFSKFSLYESKKEFIF